MTSMPAKVTTERFSRLKVQETSLIKSCQSSLEAIRLCNPNLVGDFEALRKELTAEREKGNALLSHHVNDIFHHIANFREETNKTNISAESCKEKELAIEKKITNLKEIIEKEKFKLNEAQKLLEIEIQSTQNRLDTQTTENSKMITVKSKTAKVATSHRHITNPDIIRFEKFRDEKGDTGGWEEADHILFLQVRHRHFHKGFDIFASILQSQMPELTVDNIEEHEHWFQQYKTFKTKYKAAIEIWKKNKESSKSKNDSAENKLNNKNSNASESSTKDSKRKELLSEWKKQRQARLDALNQSIKIQREKEEEKQKIEKEKQVELRQLVLEYKQKKKMEIEEAKELKKLRDQERKKEKAAQANKLLKVYRKLDTLYVERQKVLRQHSPSVKEIPRVPPSVSVERDPNRVLRHTRVWQAHCLTKPTHIKPLLHVRNLPHLAVPDWRKGVL